MKRVLLVDDDPLTLRLYGNALMKRGFLVDLAPDGLSAIKFLREAPPHIVILDLMMPTLSGVDVLKFVRGQPGLAALPVIILSNANMEAIAREAAALGVQRALLKSGCNPSMLCATLDEVLEGAPARVDSSALIALPGESSIESRSNPIATVPSPLPPTACLPSGPGLPSAPLDPELKARQSFLGTGRGTCAAFRKLFQAFAAARTPAERNLRLQDLNRKVQFVSETAGLAKCQAIAQLAGAYEAMLLAAMDAPARVGPSVMLTAMRAIDFLEGLFQQPAGVVASKPFSGNILVVDSDATSNRLVLAAFRQAKLQAQSIEDSITAWQWVNQKPYDLLFLDLLIPGLAGPEFCKRVRTLPGYESTPVIYIVSQTEFDQQAQTVLGTGEDLISKPLFPTELVLKALMHLLSGQSASTPFTPSAQTGHTATPTSGAPAG